MKCVDNVGVNADKVLSSLTGSNSCLTFSQRRFDFGVLRVPIPHLLVMNIFLLCLGASSWLSQHL